MLPGKDDEEFSVRGRARLVRDEAERERVLEAGRQTPMPGGGTLNLSPEEWLFEYDIESAASAYWENVGQPDTRPVRRRWPSSKTKQPSVTDRALSLLGQACPPCGGERGAQLRGELPAEHLLMGAVIE